MEVKLDFLLQVEYTCTRIYMMSFHHVLLSNIMPYLYLVKCSNIEVPRGMGTKNFHFCSSLMIPWKLLCTGILNSLFLMYLV